MVRARVVNHPGQWKESGLYEIQKPPKRYAIIDLRSLSELSGVADLRDFQRADRQWVEQRLENGLAVRDDCWSEAIAVGSSAFVAKVKNQLGVKATHRDVIETDGISVPT
jgi:putative transposase